MRGNVEKLLETVEYTSLRISKNKIRLRHYMESPDYVYMSYIINKIKLMKIFILYYTVYQNVRTDRHNKRETYWNT